MSNKYKIHESEDRRLVLKQTLFYFGLIGISMLFFGLLFGFTYTISRNPEIELKLNSGFYFNILFLLAGSYFSYQMNKSFKSRSKEDFMQWMWLFSAALVLFTCAQAFSFYKWTAQGYNLNSDVLVSYVYGIAWLHLLHILGALPFVIYIFYKLKSPKKDDFNFFTDFNIMRVVKNLDFYWHYLDILWIVLLLYFTLAFWV